MANHTAAIHKGRQYQVEESGGGGEDKEEREGEDEEKGEGQDKEEEEEEELHQHASWLWCESHSTKCKSLYSTPWVPAQLFDAAASMQHLFDVHCIHKASSVNQTTINDFFGH